MSVRVVTEAAELEALAPAWDELAVMAARPYCAPGWQLAWWRQAALEGAVLRTIVVEEDGDLVGLAPFAAEPGPLGTTTYRLLASAVSSPVEPLARPAREREVARAAAAALARIEPRPARIRLDGMPASSAWPELLAAGWPGARLRIDEEMKTPFVVFGPGAAAAWLDARSPRFRKRLRAARRRLETRGAAFRRAGREDMDEALDAFVRLHAARWDSRGGSGVLDDRVEAMVREAARELGPERLRVWLLELDGTAISAEIVLTAGDQVAYWLGGFDPSVSELQPSVQTVIAILESVADEGARRLDLGPGDSDYKLRLATGETTYRWQTLVPPGRSGLAGRVADTPRRTRLAVGPHIPARIRRALR
jgi:CelD/BcsL family acetyltransferase involved in cellulose biosynthesis